jgi:hypothetical protein
MRGIGLLVHAEIVTARLTRTAHVHVRRIDRIDRIDGRIGSQSRVEEQVIVRIGTTAAKRHEDDEQSKPAVTLHEESSREVGERVNDGAPASVIQASIQCVGCCILQSPMPRGQYG